MDEEKKEVKQFEFADLHLECSSCGGDYILQKKIKGGIQIILPTTDSHELALVCEKCNAKLKLYYTESSKLILDEVITKQEEEVVNEESREGETIIC
jgi:hypothetical protein